MSFRPNGEIQYMRFKKISPGSILFVCPFPPPVYGSSNMNLLVRNSVSKYCEVSVCNQSPLKLNRDIFYYCRRLVRTCAALFMVAKNAFNTCPKLYMSVDAGYGSLLNLAVIIAARITHHKILLHHHSFAYINRRSVLMSIVISLSGRNSVNIYLCERMKTLMSEIYRPLGESSIVPNLIETEVANGLARTLFAKKHIVIGHLSNLSKEKGLNEFIGLIKKGIPERNIKGILAGPASSREAADIITCAQKELGDALDYRGAAYGEAKNEFFNDIDVFVFPAHNEAQPLVLFEAMSYGIPVIAIDRGCIRGDLLGSMSLVIDKDANFIETAYGQLMEWHKYQATGCCIEKNLKKYSEIQAANRKSWDIFIDRMLSW